MMKPARQHLRDKGEYQIINNEYELNIGKRPSCILEVFFGYNIFPHHSHSIIVKPFRTP